MLVTLIMGALMLGSVYGLLGLGFSLIYSASGLMTFAQGEFFMLGAFFGLTFYSTLGLPFWLSLLLSMLILFVVGLLTERLLIRRLLSQGASMIYIVLSTIALSIILQNLAQEIWGSRIFQFPAIFSVGTIRIFGATIQPESLLSLVVGVLCMLGMHFYMTRTKYGTAMRAAAMDPTAASILGINTGMTTGLTWAIAAMLAGSIGCLVGPIMGVSIAMGTMIGLKGFAAAVIGGYGNMYGAIAGGMLLGFVETFVAAYLTSQYKDFVTFFVLILVMSFLPRGLLRAKVYDT